ncbi:MAG: hypothetical protein ACREFE_06860, partial [Limisphaerales bacterium]
MPKRSQAKWPGDVPKFSAGAEAGGDFVSVRLDKMNLIRAEFFEGKFRVGKLKTKKNYLKERTQFAPT